jgi:hypothetical protein
VRERKKRNGMPNVLRISRLGTGTQIVHWWTLVG